MLLEFKTKNYKTFKEDTVFSMNPAPKQKGLDYSLLKEKIGRITYKGLSSAVIYGPNASGKTNIIGAMDTFKNIILRGNIRNSDKMQSSNAAAGSIELIPCNSSSEQAPVEFAIAFINNNIKFDYSLSIDIGEFMDIEYKRKIIKEKLSVNEKIVFDRSDELTFGDFRDIKLYGIKELKKNLNAVRSIAKNNLEREDLFLLNGFKTMFSTKLVHIMTEWFEKKLMIIYKTDAVQPIKKFADSQHQTIYIDKTLKEAAKVFGINSNALGYLVPEGGSEAKLYSLLGNEGDKTAISAESYESCGTIKFINEFPLIISALADGATLVIDEFDTSIHPMALMSIISMFHNDDINKNNAQLIFNTHNPIFLNKNLYRRDEIKFVERDDETHQSTHYSLSDFCTKKGVRSGEDYMKNYFISQYGAIKDIDFSPIFADDTEDEV